MKKLLCLALALLSVSVFAQENQVAKSNEKSNPIKKALTRFEDPAKGNVVFIEKGKRSLGISGSFRSFQVGGENALSGDGYGILSLLNIGEGKLMTYEVSPSFSYFIANDVSLGFRLDYSGYQLDSDLRLDLRDVFGSMASMPEMNIRIAGRHMVSNSWGGSVSLRRYLSFFGSKAFGVFGEAFLYGKYGQVTSCPIKDVTQEVPMLDENGNQEINIITGEPMTEIVKTGETMLVEEKTRISDAFGVGLKLVAGACYQLKDGSAIFVSIPIVGVGYSYTKQFKNASRSTSHMSQFNISRDIDYLAIKVGYTHFIGSKKKK